MEFEPLLGAQSDAIIYRSPHQRNHVAQGRCCPETRTGGYDMAHMVSDDGQPVVVTECAEATSVDRVVYIIMLG